MEVYGKTVTGLGQSVRFAKIDQNGWTNTVIIVHTYGSCNFTSLATSVGPLCHLQKLTKRFHSAEQDGRQRYK